MHGGRVKSHYHAGRGVKHDIIKCVPHGTERGTTMARQRKKTNITYRVAESDCVKVLERYVESGNDDFVFYDICICNIVIIKDCRLVSGKNGDFISTPARKAGDSYYPYAYISEAVQDAVLDLLDDESAWQDTDETYLTFDKPDKQEKQEKPVSNRRRR